jgi:hypothetical protein
MCPQTTVREACVWGSEYIYDQMIALSTTQSKLSYLATNHIEKYVKVGGIT